MRSDNVGAPPPPASQYVSLPSEENDEPPPSYDAMAFAWSANQLGEADMPPRYECSERDSMEMEKRGTKLFLLSLFCFCVDGVILAIGAAAGRHTGMYVTSNIVALIVFACGVVNFFPRSHTSASRVRIAQAYFFVLLVVCVIGLVLGIVFTASINSRIIQFCLQPGRACHNTSGMLVWGTLLSVVATGIWILFFSVFARSTFLYLVAAERSHLARSPEDGSRIAKSVHRAAKCLPHYSKIGRSVSHHCKHVCDPCTRCVHACTHCSPEHSIANNLCLACCLLSLILVFVLCLALPAGQSDVFCLILEIAGSFN